LKDAPAKTVARSLLLARVERHLIRTGAPKSQIMLLVWLTGMAGLLTSVSLLHLHLEIMAVRYILSVTVAYGTFLALVWLWIVCQGRRWNRIARRAPRTQPVTDLWELSSMDLDWLDFLDLMEMGEVIGPLLLVAAAFSIVFVLWYLISAIAFAPESLAEMFIDGVISAALYRRLKRIDHRHWLQSAFAKTRAPFLWTLLFFAFFGVVTRYYAPEAISIGGVFRHLIS
jgi:hypothetical protein